MHDVKEELRLFDLQGKLISDSFDLPCAGQIAQITGRREDTEFFFQFTSFLYPGVIFRQKLAADGTPDAPIVFRETKISGINPSEYFTKQVFYESKDGTKVPMYIISSSAEPTGDQPALLYGYGGFNISLLPTFSISRLMFLKHFGGMVAVPNLRGGGEYGEEWHKAGVKDKKQNVFDDFQAAAEYLIAQGYTTSQRLAIMGGSNGGLLVGACVNQRPDLFGCGVAAVGVLDMLRFHKFTIGWAWCSDYGCSDNEEDFHFLRKYSPLHTVKKGTQFPSLMLTTADHDDRVVPLHSFKYIAEVQHQLSSEPYQKNPLIIRIETKAGHGAGKPLSKVIEEQADVYSFIGKSLGAEWRD